MLFSSSIFLFFFLPVVFVIYYVLSFSRLAQNIWLFVTSLFFYAWGEPIYVLLMLASILVNWGAGLLVDRFQDAPRKKKAVLVLACIMNLGALGVFKYAGFIIRNINSGFPEPLLPTIELALPIGISFFTFQALSYVIDVYRKDTSVEKNPFYVGLYVAFFPQLIAGPIVRYNSVAEQIRTRKSSWDKLTIGCTRFVVGLGKKILISNNVAILADQIFSWSEMGIHYYDVPVVMAWLGIIAYTLQIYFDFSGYSDMAIGLGLMFGFKFEENFNYPYAATSVLDFWRRWHISLTSWFREYVYFPLGGSRVENKDTMVRNIFIVWLLTGIWHGAEWTFLFWGLWHFVFQIAERFFGYGQNNRHTGWMRIYTLLVVMLGWVLFRARDLYQANVYFQNLFGISGNSFWNDMTGFLLREYSVFLVIGIIFSFPVAQKCNNLLSAPRISSLGKVMTVLYPVAMMGMFLLCVAYLVRGGYNPFIYFNF